MLRVTPLDVPSYRGFEIGRITGRHGYKPAWRIPGREWVECFVIADDDFEDLVRLAKECIDFRYNEYALEAQIGRPLTMEDIITLHKTGEL